MNVKIAIPLLILLLVPFYSLNNLPEAAATSSGIQGAAVTIKVPNLVHANTYTVCFSTATNFCSVPASVPNAVYSFTGSQLIAGKTLHVPQIIGGQYYVVVISPSPASIVVGNAPFAIISSKMTFPNSAGVGTIQKINATNLVGASTYTICFGNSPFSTCSVGISKTGAALAAGTTITVPDLVPGIYYVNIESSTVSTATQQIVATSSVIITTPETLSTSSGLQGAAVTIKVPSLVSSTTYTVCFSTATNFCSVPSSVPNAQFSFTGSQLIAGKTLHVPQIIGGQYYVDVISPVSIVVSSSSFNIVSSSMTFPNTAGVGTTQTINATNLIGASTYTICFGNSPFSTCSVGISKTGAALAAGTTITVPDLANLVPGQFYFVNIESSTVSTATQQIVATSSVIITTPETLSTSSGLQGAAVTIKVPSLVHGTTYTVCFSTVNSFCSIPSSVPNAQFSFTGSQLIAGQTLHVPQLIGGQYYVNVISPVSIVVSTSPFTIVSSTETFPKSGAAGSSQIIKATNLIGASTYTICFGTFPSSTCSSGISETGSALKAGVSILVPNSLASGSLNYVNIESSTVSPIAQQIVATSTFVVTGGSTSVTTLNQTLGLQGAPISIKATNLVPGTTYTVCFSTVNSFCSIPSFVPNDQFSFTGSQLSTGQTLHVPQLIGGQYFVLVSDPSFTVKSVASFTIMQSKMTFPNTAGVGTTQTINATNLVGASTYTICFVTFPSSTCSVGISKTGAALAAGTTITVPDLVPGIYYVNIESSTVSPVTQQIVATSSVIVTTPITLT